VSLRTVSRRYANALFDVAQKAGSTQIAERDLQAFAQLVTEHAELRQVFETPAVPSQRKRAIVEGLLATSDDMSPEVGRLLLMLAERDRMTLLPGIAAAFAERLMQDRHIVAAEVITAVPLPESQRAALMEALRRAAGSDVTITETVDPSIVGGVVARVGSVVFDGSVTRQLERMRQKFLEMA
jgi:F-type H+-transporting ATPase subunit delta